MSAGRATASGGNYVQPTKGARVVVDERRARRFVVAAVISALAVVAFVGGQAAARNRPVPGLGHYSEPSAGQLESMAGPMPALDETLTTDPAASVESLRFLAFVEPTTLIDADSDAELNNSVGVDTKALGDPKTVAVVADLVVTGQAGLLVAVHPGDRPGDAVSFTIPPSGRLLVPHLIAPTDDDGRVVVSADGQVHVVLDGIGRYVRADSSRAGRFVATGSRRIGSLVTATDGRRLVITLPDVLGTDAPFVGQVVVRLNANVGRTGGSVSVGSGDPIPWPAPASPDLGLAGTELLTVTPNQDGEIVMDYLGGSVMTVDLVGYYTNDTAPESSAGLLMLLSQPEVLTVEAEELGVILEIDSAALFAGGDTPALVTVEATNGGIGGSLTFWKSSDPVPAFAAFALAPTQQRSTTEWLDGSGGSTTFLSAPVGASLRIWTLGAYR